MRGRLARQQHDYKLMKNLGVDKELLRFNKKLVEAIDVQLKKIESDIEKIIMEDGELKGETELMRSVPGVGKVVSWDDDRHDRRLYLNQRSTENGLLLWSGAIRPPIGNLHEI